jgi:hypothetical protein
MAGVLVHHCTMSSLITDTKRKNTRTASGVEVLLMYGAKLIFFP